MKENLDKIATIYSPFTNYVSNILPLMLKHVWQLYKLEDIEINSAMNHCAWISRLITLDNRVLDKNKESEIENWLSVKKQLLNHIEECKESKDLELMINDCMSIISPIVSSRFQNSYKFDPKPFHCWWYTIHEEEKMIALHLINAYQPQSPFDHLLHFASTMKLAVEEGLNKFPHLDSVTCGSWLNKSPKFLALWPPDYIKNQVLLNETGGLGPGAWGQYFTTDGGFHFKRADYLMMNGKHPFPLTEGRIGITELSNHLHKFILNLK